MSLYSDYIKEHIGDECIELDNGFVTYRYIERSVYIVDIYIVPEQRKFGLASKLADMVAEQARSNGCNEMLGSVVIQAPKATQSLKVLLAYGMTLKGVEGNMIILRKEI